MQQRLRIILLCFIAIIWVVCLSYIYTRINRPSINVSEQRLFTTEDRGPSQSEQTFSHLILVPCHLIYLMQGSYHDVDSYRMHDKTQFSTLKMHIQAGVDKLKQDRDALLVFSGSYTQSGVRISEASSYYYLMLAIYPDLEQGVRDRILLEDYSRDSYENLLYSYCKFLIHNYQNTPPSRVTVVGFEFKRKRFTDLHRAALQINEKQFTYIGIDPMQNFNSSEVARGEYENAYKHFKQNLYGCTKELIQKRMSRDPYRRSLDAIPLFTNACPLMRRRITACI
ncbi:hypothetical protein MP228_012157 [Amoeboaphelidium protococcarum]|nr:hypothetical protein MP228_012157 [Amoeboaphelidium protococcarum]